MPVPSYVLFSRVSIEQGRGKWSFTLEPTDGSPVIHAADVEPNLRGERLELLSVVRAMEALDQPARITLFCESPHIRRRITSGLDEWRDAGWRWEAFGEMTPIANADLWRRIDRALRIHQVECRSARTDESRQPLATTPPPSECRPEPTGPACVGEHAQPHRSPVRNSLPRSPHGSRRRQRANSGPHPYLQTARRLQNAVWAALGRIGLPAAPASAG